MPGWVVRMPAMAAAAACGQVVVTMGMPNSTANSRPATASGSMLPPWPLTISSLRKPSATMERTMQRSTAWKVA